MKFGSLPSSLLLLCLCSLASAASVDEWRRRSIYQIMTDRFAADDGSANSAVPGSAPACQSVAGAYCGGTWQGIIQNLDYIQGMNFDAIWISPVVGQLQQLTGDGSSYAGYWQQDLYALNDKFGSADDLRQLISELHDRNMFLMMDVVPNHMAYAGQRSSIDYSVLSPFDDKKYFHPYCAMDYSGDNITALEKCWLGSEYVPLPDLKTEDDGVRDMLGQWIHGMVANYSVDGLRIDAGANVEPDFFTGFVKSAGVFSTAEVYMSNASEACEYQDTVGSILNYPLFWTLTDAFMPDGDLNNLADMMNEQKLVCKDTTALATFSENHDVPRFANHTRDLSLAQNVAASVIMYDGIPVVYQGQEQHFTGGVEPFTNREALWQTRDGFNVFAPIYQLLATLNTFRRHVMSKDTGYVTTKSSVVQKDQHTLVLRKGGSGQPPVVTVLNNLGADAPDTVVSVTDHGYGQSTALMDVVGCAKFNVDSSGALNVGIQRGLPRVLYPADALKDSTLCNTGGNRFKGDSVVMTSIYTTTIGGRAMPTTATATIPTEAATTTASNGHGHKHGSAISRPIPPIYHLLLIFLGVLCLV
ncbi:glycoside hydrolase family 13 protein [Piedraia hortae CBS 480.64]|uniref:alpha-amylase n=1 Tax=Piedraia hortae CBS 480.64 TaxID=1314780 RepID=A0A6A7BX95_9PEZI|nr:glycoside hydrolase family 13 protein [Piedraia hortae CBS 480.64]